MVAAISTTLSVIVAIKAWILRKELMSNYNLFFYFFITDALFDLVGAVFFKLGINNTFLMDFFSIIGFLLISTPFLKYLNFKPTRFFYSILIALVTLISFYALFDTNNAEKLDLVQITLQSLTLIFITAIVLYNFSISPEVNMFHSPVFWLALGTFIYSLIDSVVTSATNFIFDYDSSKMIYVWMVSIGANIIRMLCIFKGLNQLKT